MASRTCCGITTWNLGEMVTVCMPYNDGAIDRPVKEAGACRVAPRVRTGFDVGVAPRVRTVIGD